MSHDSYRELILRHSRPLAPITTGVQARLEKLPDVRCVLFDVYGTLLISGSGEVGTLLPNASVGAFSEALAAIGISAASRTSEETQLSEEKGRTTLVAAVAASHRRDHAAGVDYPEVDIVEIWQVCLSQLADEGLISLPPQVDYSRLALEYELRTNPVWPMPGAGPYLATLRERGILTGIISNAQFFTPQILAALMAEAFRDLESSDDVQYYSYRHRQAKPGEALFRLAAQNLADRGISPSEVLYVGNDMLNDIWPASRVGFRTALFAGDQRSLRWRENDERVANISADLVVTELASLAEYIGTDSR